MRRAGWVLSLLSAALIAAGLVLNSTAVRNEGGGMGDFALDPGVASLVLASAAFAFGFRSWLAVGTRGTVAATVLAVLAALSAFLTAWAMYIEPEIFNAFQAATCSTATPGPCGYQVPASDVPRFYPAAIVGVVAGLLAMCAAVCFVRGHAPRPEIEPSRG